MVAPRRWRLLIRAQTLPQSQRPGKTKSCPRAGVRSVLAALFLPVPLSGMLSTTGLPITAMGLIERDGVVTLLILGACSVI